MVRAIPQNLRNLQSSTIARAAFEQNLTPGQLRQRGVSEQQLIEIRREMQKIKAARPKPKLVTAPKKLTGLQQKFGIERAAKIVKANKELEEVTNKFNELNNRAAEILKQNRARGLPGLKDTPEGIAIDAAVKAQKLLLRSAKDRAKILRGKPTVAEIKRLAQQKKKTREMAQKISKGPELRDTSFKIGGKVLVGSVDRQGVFIPSVKGDNVKVFSQVKTAFRTNKLNEIERIKKIPAVAEQLKQAKTATQVNELLLSRNLIKLSKAKSPKQAAAVSFQKNKIIPVKAVDQLSVKTLKLQAFDPKNKLTPQTLGFQAKNVSQALSLKASDTLKYNPIPNNIKLSTDVTTLEKLELLRKQADKGDRNVEAAFIGIISLPFATKKVVLDTIRAVPDLFNAQTWKNINGKTISDMGGNLGRGLQEGSPVALVEFLAVTAPIKIPRIPKIKSKQLKKSFSNLRNNLKNQLKVIDENLKLLKPELTTNQIKNIEKLEKKAKKNLNDIESGKVTNDVLKTIKIDPSLLRKTKTPKELLTQNLPKVIIQKPKKFPVPQQTDKLINFIEDNFQKLNLNEFKKLRNKIKKQRGVVFILNKKGKVIQAKRRGQLLISKKKIDSQAPTKKFVSQLTSTRDAEIYVKEIKQGKTLSQLSKKDINNLLDKPKGRELISLRIKQFEKQRTDLIKVNEQLIAAGKTIGRLPNERAVKKRIGQEVARNKGLIKTLERRILELKKAFKEFKKKEVPQDLFANRKKIFEDKFKKDKLKISSKVTERQNTATIKLGEFEFEFIYNQPIVPLRGSKKGRLQSGSFEVNIRRTRKSNLKNFQKFKDNTQKDFNKANKRSAILNRANKHYEKSRRLEFSRQRKLRSRDWDKDNKKKFESLRKQIKAQEKILDTEIRKAFRLQFLKVLGLLRKTDIQAQQRIQLKLNQILKNLNKLEFRLDKIKPVKIKVTVKTSDKPAVKPIIKPTIKPGEKTPGRPPRKPPRLLPAKPPIKPLILPRIDITFNTKLKKGERLAFDIVFRSKGKVLSLNTRLPLNKALNRLSNLIDRTTSRSAELRIVGITKVKDLRPNKKVLAKFRKRKTKKVLRLVEKRKFAIDTTGEKKGLTIAKALKKRKVKKK